MVLRGVREKEKGASRKESERAGGLRCSGAADMRREIRGKTMHSVCRTRNRGVGMKRNLRTHIDKYRELYVILNYLSRWLCVFSSYWPAEQSK